MFLDRLLRRKIMHNNAAKKVMFPEEEKSFCIRKRKIPSIGFCRYAYISFSKDGCKVLKYFG